MKDTTLASKALVLTAALIFSIAQVRSAIWFVSVDGSGFSPSILNIETGDTVVWTNYEDGYPHTTTSTLSIFHPDYWDSSAFDFEETYTKTFDNVGTFNYYDQIDSGTGTIIVSAPAPPPEITLTNSRIVSGQFLFDATGLTVGKTNVLQMSTNLVQWISVSTNITGAGTATFTNSIASGPRLFRLFEQP